jgi:cytochrome c oxidase subunit 2
LRAALCLVVVSVWLSSAATAQVSVDAGRRGYEVCAGCHGFLAEGNELVGAPRLAGLPSWYLERQMRNFAAGLRGGEGDDHGLRMAPMARTARDARQLQDLLAYLATLPGKPTPPTVVGDAAEGARRYPVCSACHGQNGEGNEALGAPGLATLDDWYFVRQLRLFAKGLRGFRQDDTWGQQMRAVAGAVNDEQAQRDLAAHVRTFVR